MLLESMSGLRQNLAGLLVMRPELPAQRHCIQTWAGGLVLVANTVL